LLNRKKTIPSFIWQLLLMGLLGFSGVIFMPLLLRCVDPQIMATVLVAQVVVYYFSLLIQFGFNWSAPAAFARAGNQSEVAHIWHTSIRIKIILLIGLVSLLGVIGYFYFQSIAIYLIGFALLLSATAVNSNWLLQARSDFSSGVAFALFGVAASFFTIYFITYKVFSLDPLVSGLAVVLILIFPTSFLGLGSWWLCNRLYANDELKESNAAWHQMDALQLWENAPIVVTQLLQLVSATLGTVVVNELSDALTTNAYASMERLFNLIASVIVALYMAAYPRLASLFYEKRVDYWTQVGGLLKLGVSFGIGASVLFVFFGQTLLTMYVSQPLAVKVTPVMLIFTLWLSLYLSQHVLTGYFVFAQRNGMVFIVNLVILIITVAIGYPMARYEPVFWVYGMLAGQVVAVMWLIRLYHDDRRNSVATQNLREIV